MKKLIEMYCLKEGPFDDLNNQLAGAQSLRGGPTTSPSVRKHQDRAKRWNPSVAGAQADIDAATSVAKREALGDEKTHPIDLTVDEMHAIANWADMYGDDEDPKLLRKIEAALRRAEGSDGDSSYTSMTRVSSKKTPFGGGM